MIRAGLGTWLYGERGVSADLALGMGVYSKGGFPQEVMPSQHVKRLLARKRGAERWGKLPRQRKVITAFPKARV